MEQSGYHVRDSCRLCLSRNLRLRLCLTPTPPANELVENFNFSDPVQEFPLYLVSCDDCFHVQLPIVISPERLFRNYVYVSGTSSTFVKHFHEYASYMIESWSMGPGNSVLEIGSNDGTMLKALKQKGMSVLGIDPALKIAEQATSEGIETLPVFFNDVVSDAILESRGTFDAVVANNVFAHTDDIRGFAKNVLKCLGKDGLFFFEVSYLPEVIKNTLFDTIYHEHLSYHHVHPLKRMFSELGATVVDVKKVNTHGGSIRCVVKNGRFYHSDNVYEFVRKEHDLGLNSRTQMDPFRVLEKRINSLRSSVKDYIYSARSQDRRIFGYGAPAKATTLMYHFGLGRNDLSYIIDDSPWKQNLYTPGKGVQIFSKDHMDTDPCSDALVLAWNFSDGIIKMLKDSHVKRAVVPIPEFQVIELKE